TCRKTFHELIENILIQDILSVIIKNQYTFIRIQYSKLNYKPTLSTPTRTRKEFFVQLSLKSFDDELFNSKNNTNKKWLNLFHQKILSNNQEFNLKSYEIFIKYTQHSLLLSKTFTYTLGVYTKIN
ncbi:unnamed protein product, partial [Rotaria sp. Silwood2]